MILIQLLKKVILNLNSHIRYKLFLISSFIVLIPILLFGFISYNLSSEKVKEDFIVRNLNTNATISASIDDNYYELQQQVFALYTVQDDLNYMLYEDSLLYTDEYYTSLNRLNNYFNFNLSSNNIFGVSLIDMKGDVKYTINLDGKNTNLTSIKDIPWFTETINLNGKTLFREPHISEFLFYNKGDNPTNIVSIAQVIYDANYGEPIGIVVIDQVTENFFGYTSKTYVSTNNTVTVFSNSDNLVYSSQPLTEEMLSGYLSLTNASTSEEVNTLSVDDEEVLFISNPRSKFGFRVISSMPTSDLKAQSNFLRDNTLITLLLLSLVIIIASSYASNMITKRVHWINELFSKLGSGDFDIQITEKGQDELTQITSGFNNMVTNIQTLIDEKYNANILRQQAELDSLHSQVNPHFLYNTLNSIKVITDAKNNGTASSMIQNLSELLRYSLSKGKYIVTLEEELEHIRVYMAIYKERFSNKYELTYDIDPETLSAPIPWMTLQPLLENALQHGLAHKQNMGEIQITSKANNQLLMIYIYDNGLGISYEELKEINVMLDMTLKSKDAKPDSIGIYNVNQRIKMHFGDNYGLRLSSVPNEYTISKLTLPLE